MGPELSIVVPLRNESANVGPLVNRIVSALRHQPRAYEVVLVNDGSTDDTWEQMLGVAKANLCVRNLRLVTNAGQSAALWTGLRASHGAIIATLDGDLQNDPADLPAMLDLLKTCHMVCGVRAQRKDNLSRRFSSWVARGARKTILRIDVRDSGCSLRVFHRAVLEVVPVFDGFHRFLPILVQSAGAVVRQVPVRHHARVAGRSHYGIWNRLGRGLVDLVMVGWFIRRRLKGGPYFQNTVAPACEAPVASAVAPGDSADSPGVFQT